MNVVSQDDFENLETKVRDLEDSLAELERDFDWKVNERVIKIFKSLSRHAGVTPVSIFHLTRVIEELEKENKDA